MNIATMPAHELLEALKARPDVLALLTKPKPRKASFGDTPKQKAAFNRLSPERQSYILDCDKWRAAWRQWRYFTGAAPGPYPIDTQSMEAKAMIQRQADMEAMRLDAEERLLRRWGGDAEARDKALEKAPKRYEYRSDDEHHAAVIAFMNEASAKAREQAQARNQTSMM